MKRILSFLLVLMMVFSLSTQAFAADDVLYCRICGRKIPTDSLVCPYCGEKVVHVDGEDAAKPAGSAPAAAPLASPAPATDVKTALSQSSAPSPTTQSSAAVPGPFSTTSGTSTDSSHVRVTKSPTSEAVTYGGSCTFVAHAANATSVTWYIANCDASIIWAASDAPANAPGLSVSGTNSDTLYLSGIPAWWNGFQVQACFTGEGGPVYSEPDNKDVVAIANNAIREAKSKGHDVVIIDTAGRLAIDEDMMREIESLKKAVNPDETLFVVDSMTGQDAVNTAKTFNDRLDFDGVVLTKLDGDTRGGAALSIRTVVTKPIKFIGTGEKMEAIDAFHPSRMADRILGMGDVVSLVERAQALYDEEEAKKMMDKLKKNKFDFNDFMAQIQQIKKMGNLKDLASMIPGVGKAIKDVDIDDDAFKSIEAIIQSMTPKERANPQILNQSRRMRIARGSGTTIQEVNKLIKQFDQMRKMMQMVTNTSKMNMMMNAMRGKMPNMPNMPK